TLPTLLKKGAAMRIIIICVAAAIMLAGCIDIDQSLVVESRDKATITSVITADARLYALMAANSEAGEKSFCDKAAEQEKEGFIVTSEVKHKDGNVICTVKAETSLDRLIGTGDTAETENIKLDDLDVPVPGM